MQEFQVIHNEGGADLFGQGGAVGSDLRDGLALLDHLSCGNHQKSAAGGKIAGIDDINVLKRLCRKAGIVVGRGHLRADGEKHRPIMIHRVVFGSIERFIGILIEHFAGKFPLWLSPVQVKILPISDKYNDYAAKVKEQLAAEGLRCDIDNRAEKIGYKIREARMDRVPYIVVVGEKEQEEGKVSVRSRFLGDEGQKPLAEFIAAICEEIRTKEIRKIEVKEENK